MTPCDRVPLGEVCIVNPRAARREVTDDTLVTFVPMAAVDSRTGTIGVREERRLAEVANGFTAFQEGDVLFAKITPCMQNGKAAIARRLTNGIGRGSTEFYVLRPGPRILGEYVWHFVRQPRFREAAKRSFTGTAGQQRVPRSFMEIASIPLPPLDAQRRIVDILNRAARIEALRTRAAERLREFVPALFVKMFGDGHQVAGKFPSMPLREAAGIASGATKGRRLDFADAVEVPYLRVANVQDGFLALDEIKTIAIRRGEQRRYALAPGDLLMTEGGDLDKLGRAAIWNGELDYCAHQNHVFRVRPRAGVVLSDYLRDLAGSAYGKAYFLSIAKRTTGIASINKTQLGGFPVPVPPLDLQRRYAETVEAALAVARVAESSTTVAAILMASLTSELIGDDESPRGAGRA